MHYLLAIALPPLALLLAGKVFQAIFNFILLVIGILFIWAFGSALWIICIIHAFFVVHSHKQDKQTKKIIEAMKDDK